jgi:hypothetical protein
MMCTCSGGTGSGVSIALACGCTSSGQVGSHSHNALPQRPQKWRTALLRRSGWPGSRSTAWYLRTWRCPLTFSVAASAPRLIA